MLVVESSKKFFKELEDENGRYHSWQHCYFNFYKARGDKNADVDYLSLQLAFYLASWGMYRGSAFLLQKDYKIHTEVVGELLKEKYDTLCGITCSELKKEENQKLLFDLSDFISVYYNNVRKDVKGKAIKSNLSYTLITKILMGTMGCVPAYDRYFINAIKDKKVAVGSYNSKSILQLVDFYEKNADEFEAARKNMKVKACDLPYPQMKFLDMGFWQIGFEFDRDKKEDRT